LNYTDIKIDIIGRVFVMHDEQVYNEESCEIIKGNAINVELNKCDCEVRADIKVERKHCIRIWGQVTDCSGKPVSEALVKLLKPYPKQGCVEYAGISHTVTDCLGFYQFDVCFCDDDKSKYRILVGKPAKGNDRVIYEEGKCEPCDKRHIIEQE
jgi:hypothetical protein